MKKNLYLAIAASFTVLSGCSFSGLDAKSSFSCKAPDGVLCESMTGVYANASLNNLPSQRIK
ncbi:MAG: TraV family lipoprotein, partial [Burkholderiales bacterium]|nr:TraV family lipoprotein [Burkholderiales bacterium]